MNKPATAIIIGLFFAVFSFTFARAQVMSGGVASDGHTVKEEAKGKTIWEKLQSKQTRCANLSDSDFDALGEYFMGMMMGSSHEAMNTMMVQMMGEQGETQMHIVMGKRLSGCNTSAAFPTGSMGFMPMMQMMIGGGWPFGGAQGGSSPFGFNLTNNMMNFGYGFGFFGWIFMFFWWILIIAGIVAFIKWIMSQIRNGNSRKSALDILKERYAKGEIDKKEFEDKKRDLV